MLKVTLLSSNEQYILTQLEGSLDSNTCDTFDKEMTAVLKEETPHHVIIDIEHLSYLSSAGLRSLAILFKKLAPKKKKLLLAKPKSLVKEVLKVSGFSKLMPIYDTLDEAEKVINT